MVDDPLTLAGVSLRALLVEADRVCSLLIISTSTGVATVLWRERLRTRWGMILWSPLRVAVASAWIVVNLGRHVPSQNLVGLKWLHAECSSVV